MPSIVDDRLTTIGWILLNVFSSVAIILLNKFLLTECACNYVITLTCLHFFVNGIFATALRLLGYADFQLPPPSERLTSKESLRLAALGTLSVAALNLSLLYNSVSLYQIFKLLCIPCMLLLQPSQLRSLSVPMLLCLAALMVGIAFSTVQELRFETSSLGIFLACTGVVSTSFMQLDSASLTQAYKLSGVQMNSLQAFPTAAMLFIAALVMEIHPALPNSLLYHQFSAADYTYAFLTCLISLAVNISAYGILGKTTAVTFQVLGQVKTCCVLIGGWMIFPASRAQITFQCVFGILLAVLAATVYSILKQNAGKAPVAASFQPIPQNESENARLTQNQEDIELGESSIGGEKSPSQRNH